EGRERRIEQGAVDHDAPVGVDALDSIDEDRAVGQKGRFGRYRNGPVGLFDVFGRLALVGGGFIFEAGLERRAVIGGPGIEEEAAGNVRRGGRRVEHTFQEVYGLGDGMGIPASRFVTRLTLPDCPLEQSATGAVLGWKQPNTAPKGGTEDGL